MNRPPNSKQAFAVVTEKNPWEDRDSLPSLSLPYALLLCAVCVICALYPAVAVQYPTYWWLPLLAGAFFYFRTNRTPYGWMLLIAAFLLGSMVGGVAYGAIAVSLITSLTVTSFLYTTTRHPLLLLLPIITYPLAVLLLRDPIISLFALPTFPAAYMLGRSIMNNERRVGAICSAALTLGGITVFLIALLWRMSDLEMSVQTLLAMADTLREEMLQYLTTEESFASWRLKLAQAGYDLSSVFTQVFNLLLTLLPGFVVVLFLLIAYAAQYLCVMSYIPMKMEKYCTVLARRFTLSVLSAILFVVCAVVTLFSSSSLTLFSALAVNLFLILFPGMLVAGFWSLYASYRRRPFPLYLVLAVVFGCIMPQILLVFIALSGATATLTHPLLLRMMALSSQEDHNSDHHDDSQDPPSQS